MSISDKKQNLDQATFRPDHGCDNNGIQYSCGHINPLQRALVNNGLAKIHSIQAKIEENIKNNKAMVTFLKEFENEILEFAKVRCEEIRDINSELRSNLDNYECNCLENYECSNCEDLESEKDKQAKNLANAKEKIAELEKNVKDQANQNDILSMALAKSKTKFDTIKNIVENLSEL
jgi:flagellar motility protein MotE (MotC chaperone)